MVKKKGRSKKGRSKKGRSKKGRGGGGDAETVIQAEAITPGVTTIPPQKSSNKLYVGFAILLAVLFVGGAISLYFHFKPEVTCKNSYHSSKDDDEPYPCNNHDGILKENASSIKCPGSKCTFPMCCDPTTTTTTPLYTPKPTRGNRAVINPMPTKGSNLFKNGLFGGSNDPENKNVYSSDEEHHDDKVNLKINRTGSIVNNEGTSNTNNISITNTNNN